MAYEVSRRNFLKGAAAMTVAAAASTLLAGCSGNGGNTAPAANEVALGDYYKVRVTTAGFAQEGSADKPVYYITPVVNIAYSGKGSPSFGYSEIFTSAMLGDVKMTLANAGIYNSIVSSKCDPKFKTTNKEAFANYLANKTPMTLKVTVDDKEYAVFDIYFDGTIKASKA